jgi:hypothetical protein
MKTYHLGFISDEDIYRHVHDTVIRYRRSINLKEFNKNLIDPIKLTFDSKIYNQTMEETIKSECLRQIDKTNNNHIGYFHQYLFNYAGNGWKVPTNGKDGGFDVVNDKLHIYVEMKNKHNTMNSASTSATYLKMLDRLMRSGSAETKCYLVEVIAKHSQDVVWNVTITNNGHKDKYQNPNIRRISIDKFYELVFGDKNAFFKLCQALPTILDDILTEEPSISMRYEVYDELDKTDFYKSLYLLAFRTYEGFDGI